MTRIETYRLGGRQLQSRLLVISPRLGRFNCSVRLATLKALRRKEPRDPLVLPGCRDELLALAPAPRTVCAVALPIGY